MRKVIKILATRVFATLVLGFLAVAAILYQAEKYDIVFIPREPKTTQTVEEDATRQGGALTAVTHTADAGEGTTAAQSETTASGVAEWVDEYRAFLAGLKSYDTLVSQGYKDSGAMFDSSAHLLAILPHSFEYPKFFSYRTEIEEYTERVATSRGYETQLKKREVSRPSLKLYMGLRIIDNNDGTYGIYDKYGNRIAGRAYPFKEAYARDENGAPIALFGNKYYAIYSDGTFLETTVDFDLLPGVLFDAPEYYAKTSIKLYPFSQERVVYVMVETDERRNKTETVLAYLSVEEYEAEIAAKEAMAATPPPETIIDPLTGKEVPAETEIAQVEVQTQAQSRYQPVYEYRREKLWGYKDENGKIIIPAQYKAAYTFSDNGLAAVVGYNGALKFIDTSGRTVIDPYGNILYLAEFDNRRSYDGYYPADTRLPENLGMYYFDHGLVRVRRQIKDYYFKQRVAIDRDYLIDAAGKYFDIPENYNLVAYSDGVLTLEKDGYYGFYSHKGYWIAQPIYTVCKPFIQGLGVIGNKNGKCGMIDTDGNVVIPMVFDYISQPSSGVIAAYSKLDGWTEFIIMAKAE